MLLFFLVISPANAADEQSERRLLTGIKLFPALLAADQDLAEKRTRDGHLLLVVLYKEDAEVAREVAQRLSEKETIRDFPIRATALPYRRLVELKDAPPAAFFLGEWSPDDLPQVARFAEEQQRMLFSPFKGDVNAGAQTGIFVSDRILPLVNRRALDKAHVRLKPFLLEVAKTYE